MSPVRSTGEGSDRAKGRPSQPAAARDSNKASTVRRELVEQRIIEQATALFAERGFAATSLQDIADAAGLTRSSLYHYVASKEELLARLVREKTEEPAIVLRLINQRTDLDPIGKLRAMAGEIARVQTRSPERFRLLIRSEAELPEQLSDVYQQSRRNVLREFVRVIDDGIAAGSFRPVDPRIAALGIIGMLNWIAWWHRPDSSDVDRVTEQLADMAVESVLDAGDVTQYESGTARALASLRQNLEYLERQLGGRKS
ncbi:TetR/AcrR family transcriptional regulator [Mycolicibacterium baixiangningiae]|uniref:TetR/AcrR family transcriptional regulator n=1 Tax=Mycolicibacterium baixiangningiae TaxID=2761578 RepID=UPI0018D02AD5|nr:TetR/AcrR family transcriptional regulator [Mycolicibacterium baixiangningiae]